MYSGTMTERNVQQLKPQKPLRIAFDIGGVLSKYPHIFIPLMKALAAGGAELWVLSDMHDMAKMIAMLRMNGIGPELVPNGRVVSADYAAHGEECKAWWCQQIGIDLLIDDFPGYMGGAGVSLFVWPQPDKDYYHPSWKTAGSEGNFGRRRNPMTNSRDVVREPAIIDPAPTQRSG